MSGRIPDSFIDTLNERLNLVDVVSARMALKKAGREYSGRCPFHDDSSPSFAVNAEKQVYHCFGCGASGGLISFVMAYDRVDFIGAVESLAGLAGLDMPKTQEDPDAARRRQLFEVLETADARYRDALRHHAERATAVDYLKGRGLTGQIAHRFGLGFAPSGWRFLLDQFGTDPEQLNRLRESGLTVTHSSGREYDRFRARIMFPIRDIRGRTIGFGGRVLDDSKPKYLNSPETMLFHKSHTLYGLYEARQANRTLDRVLVVEGYMDVVALAQHGISFAIATLGTALTSHHLDQLSRQTSQVIVCFDGDSAGLTAAKRAMTTMLPFLDDAFSIRFLYLPEGHDPDSLVRAEGAEAFLKRINQATSAAEALIDLLAKEVDLSQIDGRARLTALALPMIARVRTSIFRSMMLDHLSALTGARRSDLDARLESLPTPPETSVASANEPLHRPNQSPVPSPVAEDPELASLDALRDVALMDEMPEDVDDASRAPAGSQPLTMPSSGRPEPLVNKILWILLQHPKLPEDFPAIPAHSQLINISALISVAEVIKGQPSISTASLMGHFSGTDMGRLLSQLLKRDLLLRPDDLNLELKHSLVQLKRQLVTESMKTLAEDAKHGRISVERLHEAFQQHKN